MDYQGLLVGIGFLVLVFGLSYFLLRIWCKKKTAMVIAATTGIILTGVTFVFFSSMRTYSRRSASLNNLVQIGLDLKLYTEDKDGVMPVNLENAKNYYGSDIVLRDVASQKPFIYIGSGRKWNSSPDLIVAYSPADTGGRLALYADGIVRWLTSAEFTQALERSDKLTAELPASP